MEHKRKINQAVVAGLVKYGCREDGAVALVKAIVSGGIPHVYIDYAE